MKAFFSLSTLSFLLLFARIIHARKDPGEYWRSVTKDQPMPEYIKGLVQEKIASTLLSSKHDQVNKHFIKGSEPKGYFSYSDIKSDEKKPLLKDANSRPNGDIKPTDQKPIFKDAKPKASPYFLYNDIGSTEQKSTSKDTRKRPNP